MSPYNVLFLCTGNSARSILAEALINHWGAPRFRGFSAGSFPKGEVNPLALEVLAEYRMPTDGYRSKSWDEFAGPDAPTMHFVFTVCDDAAKEVCPVWPGHPVTAHWGVADPAAVEGTHAERIRAFERTYRELEARIKLFVSLRIDTLDALALKAHVDAIGQSRAAATESAAPTVTSGTHE